MAIYYDPLVLFPRVRWSKTIYPRVLLNFEFWLCLIAHAGLTVLLRLGYVLAEPAQAGGRAGALVPLELAAPLLGLCGLTTAQLLSDCKRWHEAFTASCVRVGEQTRRFAQELQATFGLADEAAPVRFAAGKYALAAVYVFFFSLAGGAVPARGWGELRAKGLLDDREVHFLESQYSGDRMALLHVWAMWAAKEAAATPSARPRVGPEVAAGGLARLSDALRGASDAAREAASCAAVPVPYHQFQLHDALTLVSLLVLAAIAAPYTADGVYAASVLYVVVAVAAIGLREAAAAMSDPLRKGRLGQTFPVAATVNSTADAVVQLLIGASPAAFDPCPAWSDPRLALLSQNQIERRTPAAAFGTGGANPLHWQAVKAPMAGDLPPPPLLDSGCCHVDVDALPRVASAARHGAKGFQVARRPRQDGLGALLARVQIAADGDLCKAAAKSSKVPSTSTHAPSEASTEARPPRSSPGSGRTCDLSSEAGATDWAERSDPVARSGALPRETSLASSMAGFCYPGVVSASKPKAPPAASTPTEDSVIVSGAWAAPGCQGLRSPPPRGPLGCLSVSPDDLVLTTEHLGEEEEQAAPRAAARFSAVAPPAGPLRARPRSP